MVNGMQNKPYQKWKTVFPPISQTYGRKIMEFRYKGEINIGGKE